MKIKEPKLSIEWVDYHGLKLPKHKSHSFIATDKNGHCFSYKVSPEIIHEDYWSTYSDTMFIGELDLEDMDWKESLIKYPDSK